MSKRKPRPSLYLERPDVDVGSLKVVMTPFSKIPPRRGQGRPVDADAPARAEAAADTVLRLKAKNPRAAWGDLVISAAAKHHVGKERVWPALRKRSEYKARPYPPIHR
jgi:hypothetical protein